MRFDREAWRKLYIAESAEHLFMPLAVRGVRDYLIRFGAEDGTLLPNTQDVVGDLAHLLRAKSSDHDLLTSVVAELRRVGFLKLTGRRLWITKFEEAQLARSPAAKRQAKYMANKQKADALATSSEASPSASPGDVTQDVSTDVTTDTRDDVTREEKRNDETTTTPLAVVVTPDFKVPCPADLTLLESQIQTLKTSEMIPDRAISWLTKRYIANYQADTGDKRDLVTWRKCLSKAISGDWSNARIKAQYLAQAKAAADDTGGYGDAKDWLP